MQQSETGYTLDKLYNKEIEKLKFAKIDTLNSELQYLKTQLSDVTDNDEKNRIIKNISNLENKITNKKKKVNKYLLNNCNDLFSYFEMKQNIENNKNPKKKLNDFFNKTADEDALTYNQINNNINNYLKQNNFDIYNEVNSPELLNNNICGQCKKGELIKSVYDGILICNNCFCINKYLIHNDKPSYKEPPKEISFYAYRRINHFKEILAQFQAKETTDIPGEIIERIKYQIKKERINIKDLTSKKTKEILKKLGYNKYYEHITFIKDKLGIKPPIMSQKLEETLCNLFIDIQLPYSKYCPSDRVNFLNYYYTLYKLCELLGEMKYLVHFPMLKEQKKIEQDEIWKKICKDLNWDFISTL